MSIFQSIDEFRLSFYISHRGVKYYKKDLDNIYEKLNSNWNVKKFDAFNLSGDTSEELESLTIRMKASSWKSRQRSLRKKGKLDQYKIESLNRLGMVWNPKEDDWEKRYLKFRRRGLCYDLELWIKEQRKLYNSGQIHIENLHRLKAINFPFREEKNELFPFTWESYNNLRDIFISKSINAWRRKESTKTEKQKTIQNFELASSINKEKEAISDTFQDIRNKLSRILFYFRMNLHKLSFEESISLIDKIIDGEDIFRNHFIIAKYSQKIINENGLKDKYGNPKYYQLQSNRSKQKPFQSIETSDRNLHIILSKAHSRINRKLDDEQKYYWLRHFNKKNINPLVRKYCCENMINFFEIIGNEKMRSFAPVSYLISYHKSEKNIDELLKLRKDIECYPLLFMLYNYKIDVILERFKP